MDLLIYQKKPNIALLLLGANIYFSGSVEIPFFRQLLT